MTFLNSLVVIGIFTLLIIVLGVRLYILEKRIQKLLAGKKAESLEDVIRALGKDVRALETFRDTTNTEIASIEERLRRSVQGVETVRFNAFKGNGEGGNQSFAVALLSQNGDGTVLSSIYARDRISVFAKPIKNFSSEFEMTEEEKDAVARASKK